MHAPTNPSGLVSHIRSRAAEQYRRLTFRPHIGQLNVLGYTPRFYFGDYTGHVWYYRESAQQIEQLAPEFRFLRDMIGPGEVIVEAGAHHGFTALLMEKWARPGGRIFAIEASPHNFAILAKNVELNPEANITAISAAIGSHSGRVRLDGRHNAHCVEADESGDQLMIPIDEYLPSRPTMLKIDVEGMELQALEGAQKVLAARPKLAIELHVQDLANAGHVPEDIFNYVDRSAYNWFLQTDIFSPPSPYKGQQITGDLQVHIFGLPKA